METQPGISLKSRPYFTDCVQWNEDGQLAIRLDNHVHILTPILTGLSSKKDNYTHVGLSLPRFEKKVDFTPITDPNTIQTSLLTSEEGFRCVNWSPINLSKSKSCFLVIVTTKHRVLIYQNSAKDPTNSDWQLYLDLTDKLKVYAIEHTHATKINPHHALYASWSNRLIPDPLATTPALLALSNKAGDIVLWTYSVNDDFSYVSTTTPHKSFVNLLEWTNWTRLNENSSMAYIISSSTDGSVVISSVYVEYYVNDEKKTIIQNVRMETKHVWFEGHSSVVTLIKSRSIGESQIKIAICKGITLQFMLLDIEKNGDLKPKCDWKCYDLNNSALGLTGGSWINENEFRCYTVEGEGLQIQFDVDIFQSEKTYMELNRKLVQKYKQQWMEEQMKVADDQILHNASDAIPYLWGATDGIGHIFTVIYLSLKPGVDMHYRVEASDYSSVIFILQKNRGGEMDNIYSDIESFVNDPDLFFTKPFRGLIRELLQYLVDEENLEPFEKWVSRLLDYLNNPLSLSDDGLTRSIYSEPSTIAARLLINANIELQNFGEKTFNADVKNAFVQAKAFVQINYVKNILNYALQLPEEQFKKFKDEDVTVLLLITDYSLGLSDADLVQKALNMYLLLQDKFPWLILRNEIEYASTYKVEDSGSAPTYAREKCPVCDEYVNLVENTPFAQCDAGHFWELCSMTKRVLYKPNTRKCVTCGAKSLQPSYDGSLTDMILTNCYKCIICGSELLS